MNPKAGTQIVITQIIELLQTIDNERYTQPVVVFNGSSIGQHIRHIIDFYLCLIRGCEVSNIDYDKRARNLLIERDIKVARVELERIAGAVQSLDILQNVVVNSSFTVNEGESHAQIASSVGRELMYAYDHAIHHLAMVKIGVQLNYPSIFINPDLGVAPSTLKFRKQKLVVR